MTTPVSTEPWNTEWWAAQKAADAAERNLAALEKAVNSASHYLSVLQSKLALDLAPDLARARHKAAERLKENVQLVSKDYAAMISLEATLKRLAPPPAAVETGPLGSEPPQRLTQVFGASVQTTEMNGGPTRGEVEQVLGHLGSLAQEFDEPRKPGEETDAA